jgi:hypothetical protein
MEYKEIQYRVLQTNPAGWEWIVRLDADKTKTGLTYSRASAIFHARCAIDKAAIDKALDKLPASDAHKLRRSKVDHG